MCYPCVKLNSEPRINRRHIRRIIVYRSGSQPFSACLFTPYSLNRTRFTPSCDLWVTMIGQIRLKLKLKTDWKLKFCLNACRSAPKAWSLSDTVFSAKSFLKTFQLQLRLDCSEDFIRFNPWISSNHPLGVNSPQVENHSSIAFKYLSVGFPVFIDILVCVLFRLSCGEISRSTWIFVIRGLLYRKCSSRCIQSKCVTTYHR